MNSFIEAHTNRVSLFTNITEYPLGVCSGKMGWCLYLYIMAQRYDKEDWNSAATKILCSIFADINTVSSVRLFDGLTGIGVGINYLIKRDYVSGDVNKVLKDIDNIMFRMISSTEYQMKYSEKIDILYYLSIRINQFDVKSESYLLFCNLIICIVNDFLDNWDDKCFKLPFLYSFEYKLPFFLFVLSKIVRLNICTLKIRKIVDELTDRLLSIIPCLDAQKLYLMWGMVCLNRYLHNNNWNKHIDFLCKQIDLKYILNKELKSSNVFFRNGVSSIYFLLRDLKDYFPVSLLNESNHTIKNKIESYLKSCFIGSDLSDTTFLSLANNISSVILILSEILNVNYYENRFK